MNFTSPRIIPRGEYPFIVAYVHDASGSSPLSRGIRADSKGGPEFGRIIPALAGNTMAMGDARCLLTDHPRSRGEYQLNHYLGKLQTGSSPLSRGIRRARAGKLPIRRIIPALAGNTDQENRGTKIWEDHPRSRGEYAEGMSGS